MTANLLNWNPENKAAFTRQNLLFRHNLAQSELFSEDALIELIDRYPRSALEVFTMGYDPTVFGEWYLGRSDNMDGKALMQAVRHGRLWLNLRRVNHADKAIGELCDRIFAEVARETGTTNLKTDLGLLISSPNAHVVYHLDIPMVMLWQIRGVKKVYLYPVDAGFFSDAQIEGIALRESDENLPYATGFDDKAFVHDLKPGEMLTWPQNAPHRIVQRRHGQCVAVDRVPDAEGAVACQPAVRQRLLRRFHGLNPGVRSSARALEPLKIAYARMNKMMGGFQGNRTPLVPRFSLDPQRPGKIIYDEGVRPFVKPESEAA
ncbi:MAG: hypothetical protein WDN06_06410 [Asticcacaulis sp.]